MDIYSQSRNWKGASVINSNIINNIKIKNQITKKELYFLQPKIICFFYNEILKGIKNNFRKDIF